MDKHYHLLHETRTGFRELVEKAPIQDIFDEVDSVCGEEPTLNRNV